MAERAFDGDDGRRRGSIGRWYSEFGQGSRLAVLALALGAERVVNHIEGSPSPVSWLSLTGYILTTVAMFVLAAALLRLVDLMALRRETASRAKRSRLLSDEVRRSLLGRQPGRGGQGSVVDQTAMIERALRPGP
jgi:hypothetical protein